MRILNTTSTPLLVFCALLIASQTLFAQQSYHTSTHYHEPHSEAREHPVDIEKMVAEVSFLPQEGIVNGSVTHVFNPLHSKVDSIELDGIKMRVEDVRSGSKTSNKLRWRATDTSVVIYGDWKYGKKDSVLIKYSCTPRKGMYFVGWNDSTNRSRKQIWTQGQAKDNRYWCPMYDDPNDKFVTETLITFDSEYQVLSNGNLISKKKDGANTVWHYAMTKPHAGYLVMVGIGKYGIEQRKTKRGLPVNLWYYPESPQSIVPTYRYSTEMIDFMEELLGVQFPWESYSQIPLQDFIFGAMENTTATTFGDFSYTDQRGVLDRSYLNTNVHELTHQWFGDLITQRDSKSIWLHESFATFYPKMFQRKFFGEDEYQWMRRNEQNSSITASEKDKLPIVHPNAGTSRVYQKGSAVLDMLKYVVGEEQFHRTITSYLKKHSYKNIHTNDFYLAFQDELGLTLDWFFDEWLYRGGEPSYSVSYQNVIDNGKHFTQFSVEQIQLRDELNPLFEMPIVFEVHYKDGTSSVKKEWVRKQQEVITVPNPQGKEVAYTLFDPGSYILKKVKFDKSFDELREQSLKASNMIDRLDAIKAIGELDSSFNPIDKLQLFYQVFFAEKHHAVKSEIIRQLFANSEDTLRFEQNIYRLVVTAVSSPSVEVRKSVINNIKLIPPSYQILIEGMLKDSSYSIIETTLTKLCEQFPTKRNEYIAMCIGINSPHQRVKIKALELTLAGSSDKSSSQVITTLNQLIDLSSHSFEFMTRQNAMNALKRLNICNNQVVANIINAVLSQNGRLAGTARGIAEFFVQQTEYKKLFSMYIKSQKWKNWEQREIEKIAGLK
jgi:aminopeptidase N